MPSKHATMPPLTRNNNIHQNKQSLKRGWFDIKRKLSPSLNIVTFYHQVNNPYSYLLLQAIPRFLEDFDVRLNIEFVFNLASDANQQLQEQYALQDAKRLAQFHLLTFPDDLQQPSASDALKATSALLKHQDRPKLLHMTLEVTDALWGIGTTTFDSCINRYGGLSEKELNKQLKQSNDNLLNRGLRQSAMLYYGDEWYEGLDRLGHLAERLSVPGIQRKNGDTANYQRQYQHVLQSYNTLRKRPKQIQTLDFYCSFNDPYSYLAAERVFKLAELYNFPVNVKPILCQSEAEALTNKTTRPHTVFDIQREADRFGITYGKLSPPSTISIQRCCALFELAKLKNKTQTYMITMMTAIWAENADLGKNKILKAIMEHIELDWNDVNDWLDNESWKETIKINQNDLEAIGLWSSPGFKYGDLVVCGQDRIWALEGVVLSGN